VRGGSRKREPLSSRAVSGHAPGSVRTPPLNADPWPEFCPLTPDLFPHPITVALSTGDQSGKNPRSDPSKAPARRIGAAGTADRPDRVGSSTEPPVWASGTAVPNRRHGGAPARRRVPFGKTAHPPPDRAQCGPVSHPILPNRSNTAVPVHESRPFGAEGAQCKRRYQIRQNLNGFAQLGQLGRNWAIFPMIS
jgi:hypothetical protein